MFNINPKCSVCDKEIKDNEVSFVKIRWPKHKGMTEIKAYLKNEGKFICKKCFESR